MQMKVGETFQRRLGIGAPGDGKRRGVRVRLGRRAGGHRGLAVKETAGTGRVNPDYGPRRPVGG
jgi:hypothetical protein